jgi:anthranilate synthase/aminodeoxychorismate synthase-like glutamine amidotransferase
MVLLIDNYDSFTYNLAQYVGELGEDVKVVRNDEITVEKAAARNPDCLIISPGPGTPDDAGISRELIRHFAGSIPVLGVCLGHQCIASAYDGKVARADRLMHGKTSPVYHTGSGIFQGLPNPFEATRYHSLIVEEDALPDGIEVTAHTAEGEVMGIRVTGQPVEGVQFHPESILTTHGRLLLSNFLNSR